MPPRKSLSRASARAESSTAGFSKSAQPQPHAGPSRPLKRLPPLSMPESVTPAFKRQRTEGRELDDEERGILIHELVGFYPRKLCDLIMEAARQNVYDTVGLIEAWGQSKTGGMGDEYRMELDIGLHSLETLLEQHVDKAFDKFTAWALRNPFDAPPDLELVLPWHKDLDFERGQHIASLPQGEASILSELDDLRRKVEQSRYLSQQLERAEKALDRRLEIASQRKAEVGFISDTITAAKLHPLAPKSDSYRTSLLALNSLLAPMEDPHPSLPPATGSGAGNLKAWEMGRQAYLSWAVGRAVGQHQLEVGSSTGGGVPGAVGAAGAEELDVVEREAGEVGGTEGVEGLLKAIAR